MTTQKSSIKTTNAITRRIDLLQGFWDKFKDTPTAQICCWSVLQEELTMIDTFYQVNADESSDTPDIFLRLETPFQRIKSYGKVLTDELAALVDADRTDLATEDIFIDWQPNYRADTKNHAVGFLREFFQFASSLELEEGKVIIFLSPTDIKNPVAWQQWWLEVLKLQLPEQIKLMVCDTQEHPFLQKAIQQFPKKMRTLQPKLEMANAIRELMSEYGDQEDGCTHFRKAFFELTQAVAKQDVELIRQTAKKALVLARQIGFPHLEITVLCTAGNGFMMSGKTQSGITAFDEALRIAEIAKDKPMLPEYPDLKVDLPGGNLFEQLAVQTLFFKAAGFLALKQPAYEAALEVYQDAEERLVKMLEQTNKDAEKIDWSNGGITHFHRLEALRMTGYCSEQLNRNQAALKIYGKAISIAEKLPNEMRQSTMLPFVGQALLNICQKKGMKKEYWNVRKKMNDLLGDDWEAQLPKAA